MEQTVVDALGHNFVNYVSNGDATCTTNGTETAKCERCNKTHTREDDESALGHVEVTDDAVAPTCTETGLTQGSHCSRCNITIIDQTIIPTVPHEYEETYTNPTCLTAAYLKKKCVICGFENVITIEPIEAMINITGVGSIVSTEGSYTYHDYTVVASGGYGEYRYKFELFRYSSSFAPIEILESNDSSIQLKNAKNYFLRITITDKFGDSITYTTYVGSGTTTKQPANYHTIVIDERIESTCIATGLTEGSHCSTCNEIIVAQQTIAKRNHSNSEWIVDKEATKIHDGYRHTNCTVCKTVLDEEIIYATGSLGLFYFDRGTHYSVGGLGSCTDNEVVIPSVYKGKPIYSIEDVAFSYYTSITSISFSENSNIKSIGSFAFSGCTNLQHIELPGTIENIGNSAFMNCSKLKNINLPSAISTIGDNTFNGCTSLENVIIPESIIYIGASAFSMCSSLVNVIIPDKVANIGTSAFYGCTSLTTIIIPNTIKSIEDRTFSSCDNLKSVIIGSNVVIIGEYAFAFCYSLTDVVIPENLSNVSQCAFYGCDNLNDVFYMGEKTDWNKISIDYLNSNLTNATKYYYTDIEPSSEGNYWRFVNELPTKWSNSEDSSIQIYNYTKAANQITITGCKSESPTIEIPNSIDGLPVTTIDMFAFANSQYSEITLPEGLSKIGQNAFMSCNNLASIIIPSAVREIEASAFWGCENLSEVVFEDGITEITGYLVFSRCTKLSSVVLPNTLTYISGAMFQNCTSLQNITLSKSIEHIDTYAFDGCVSLTRIDFDGTIEEWNLIEKRNGWNNSTGAYTIYCVNGIIEKNGTVTYYSIGAEGLEFTLDVSGTSYSIIGIGTCNTKDIVLPNTYNDLPVTSIGAYAFYNCKSFTSITIPDSITNIYMWAFDGCSSLIDVYYTGNIEGWLGINFSATSTPMRHATNLYFDGELITNVTIPDTVTSVGGYAFYNCTSLASITIPNTVTSIGDYAFYNCASLECITIPPNVMQIGEYVFYDCTSLESVTIGGSVVSIGNRAFYNCDSLMSVTIDENSKLSSIGEYAFVNCISLSNITIPASVTSIERGLFYGCTNLTNATIGYGITSIGNYAFCECSSLASVTIPDSVTSISDYAFRDCNSLKDVYYTGSKEKWIKTFISFGNSYLTNATIHYNYVPEE